MKDQRQSEPEGATARIDGGAWRSTQPGAAAVLLDVDLAESGEIVDDALPFVLLRRASRCSTVS